MPVNRVVLKHLDRMSDSTGLIQHAFYSLPRRESGYTTDDNARALGLCVRLWRRQPSERMLNRVAKYLSFLEYARNPGHAFHNFLGYDRRWLDAEGTGDCQGQVVRALAEVLGSHLPHDYRSLARELLQDALPTFAALSDLRGQAYVVLAWAHLWKAAVADATLLEDLAWQAARQLAACYQQCSQPEWPWFEPQLTYANAVLPHALFLAGQRWSSEPFTAIAQASFAFLDRETTFERHFRPIGNDGWYPREKDKAVYDQQPVEALTMADAALTALQLLGEEAYLAAFHRAYGWFHGQNGLQQPLVIAETGACCDGLEVAGINRNQGAESTLAHLFMELHNWEVQRVYGDGLAAVLDMA